MLIFLKNGLKEIKKYYGLKIQGDSMYPKYEENDIVNIWTNRRL